MSWRSGFGTGLVLVLLLATSGALGGQASRAQRVRQAPPELVAAARARGRVRVLVQLNPEGGFVPEGRLSTRARVNRQRAAIRRSREGLLDQLPDAGSEALVPFDTIPYVALEVDESALAVLAASDLVNSVAEDRLLAPSLASTIPLIGADIVWNEGYTGAGQAVAILDTGVDAGHAFFGGRVVSEACYSTTSGYYSSTSLCPNNQGSMTGPGAASPSKCSGTAGCEHGTHVAGIAAGSGSSFHGVARGGSIVAVQVFSKFTGSGNCGSAGSCLLSFTSDQVAGLERVYALRSTYSIAAANLSLGGGFYPSTCDGEIPAYTAIVETLRSAGIATVIASGNASYTSATEFPGCISSAVTVGAVWDDDTVASFSNSASWVDLLAPGGAVTSSIPGGGYAILSGTSMATPHVTGAFALLRSVSPSATIDEIETALVSTGKPIADSKNGRVLPRIRLDLAADLLTPGEPPEITTTSLALATVGVPYSQPLAVSGGSPPLAFRLAAGALPPGLGVSATTGTISGTPTAAGSYAPTIEVTDARDRSDSAGFSLLVRLPRPQGLAPTGSTRERRPRFEWSSSTGATRYRLVVDTDGGAATVIDTIVTATSFVPTADLVHGLYGFRVLALDDLGNTSDLSTRVEFDVDTIAPDASPLELSRPLTYLLLPGSGAQASSELNSSWSALKAVDGNPASAWSTPGKAAPTEEHLGVDLGATVVVGRLRLRSRLETGALFPADFELQLSVNGTDYVTVASASDFIASAATDYDFSFGPTAARFARLLVTRPRLYSGLYYVQLAEMTAYEPRETLGAIDVRWTAPGDDGALGAATAYDLRWSTSPIDATNFGSATRFPVIPIPQAAGSLESSRVTGLVDEQRYYIALETRDDVGNASVLSTANLVTAGEPPAPVSDLAVTASGPTTISLRWTATGDDGLVGTADHYEIRYASSPLGPDSFALGTLVETGVPLPAASGAPETMTLDGLQSSSAYYLALRVHDRAGNVSALSNVVSGQTADITPPSQVTLIATPGSGPPSFVGGVTAVGASSEASSSFGKEKTTDGDPASSWSTAPSATPSSHFIQWNLGGERRVERVRLRARDVTGVLFPVDYEIQLSSGGSSWATVASASGVSVAAGAWVSHDFPPSIARHVRLLVTRPALYAVTGQYYSQLAEAEIYDDPAIGGAVTLNWLAPGDDGNSGTASTYQLCYARVESDVDGFCAAGGTSLSIPVSGPAGTPERYVVSGLDGEARYYFSLRAGDDAPIPNLAPPSDVVSADTLGIPPAGVSDLSVRSRDETSVELSWTASGDDGTSGVADRYLLCYSTVPVEGSSFCLGPEATLLTLPVTGDHTTTETATVAELDPALTYYFGLVVEDELGNASPLSNVLILHPRDRVPPDAVTAFQAAIASTQSTVPATAVSASGEILPSYGKERATDGNPATSWSTPGRATLQEEFLVVDLGTTRTVSGVELLSRDATGALFPVGFALETALVNESASYVVRTTVAGFTAASATTYSFSFASVAARFVRLRVTTPARYSGDGRYYVQLAEMNALEATTTGDEIALSWLASGDDGTLGTATSYRLCYSPDPDVVLGFCASSGALLTLPVTGPAGTVERATVSGLAPETLFHFGIKALDEDANESAAAFVDAATLPVPPAPASEFRVLGTTPSSISLEWRASGDDGLSGLADHYELCVSTNPILESTFCGGTAVSLAVTGLAGTPEGHVVTGLDEDRTYYLALRVVDDLGAFSSSSQLTERTEDATGPEPPSGLDAAPAGLPRVIPAAALSASGEVNASWGKEKAVDGDPYTAWSTPGRAQAQEEFLVLDLGAPKLLLGARLRSRQDTGALFPKDFVIETSSNGSTFDQKVSRSDVQSAAATWHELPFPAATLARFVRLRVTASRVYGVTNTYYTQLSELQVQELVPRADAVDLSWMAPHENGASGGAADRYLLKMSTTPITEETFDAAPDAPGLPPSPSDPGSAERFTVEGLAPDSTYYFGLVAIDEAGHRSTPVFMSTTLPPS